MLAMRAKSLSDSTMQQTYAVLGAGLDGAVRDGLLARNPAALVARPGGRARRGQTFRRPPM